MNDQFPFDEPVKRYGQVEPAVQRQDEPRVQARMTAVPNLGEISYRGLGRFTGRKAPITGRNSGIGGAVAIAFAREGADVAISYLPDEEEDARDRGDQSRRAHGRRVARRHHLCILLPHPDGRRRRGHRVEDLSDEQFELTFRTIVFASFWITKAMLTHLGPGSVIISTATLEADPTTPDRLDYTASKATINNFAKGLAQQLVPRGIHVNVAATGPTWTALQMSGGVSDEQMTTFDDESTYNRAGQLAELAPTYVFLALAESSFVSGETTNVNGTMPTP